MDKSTKTGSTPTGQIVVQRQSHHGKTRGTFLQRRKDPCVSDADVLEEHVAQPENVRSGIDA